MSGEPDEAVPIIDTENLPKFCEYHKFHLVEELALETDFRQLHYGKCAVIGRINLANEYFISLENVYLKNLPSEYSLPVGSVELQLRFFNCAGDILKHGCFYIIYGEVVIIDVNKPGANHIPKTARGIHEDLLRLTNENERTKYLKSLHETHKTALNACFASQIDSADLLAECNLQLRLIRERINEKTLN